MQSLLNDIAEQLALETERGQVADYIPQLAGVDPHQFGISLATVEGETFSAGSASTPFSIQSISKLFTLTMALGKLGDGLWVNVGREPSGDPFNSIVQLEHEGGKPRNPFINAGAIAVVDAIMMGHEPKVSLAEILNFVRYLADDASIFFDHQVAASEMAHKDRNASLAHFMKAFGRLRHDVDKVLGTYFHQCAIAMSCEQLARAGLFLASDGVNRPRNIRVVSPQRARRINSLMMMCGHYDASGEFAFRVGLPGKSGVGGGILAIAPGRGALAVWSPGLDEFGNSLLGTRALELFVQRTEWSVFGH
ncbi:MULTISPECIES: glutaminase [unclassified Vreelandella]